MARTPAESESSVESARDDNTVMTTPPRVEETPAPVNTPAVRTPLPKNKRELNLLTEEQLFEHRINKSLMDLCFNIFRIRDFKETFEYFDHVCIWEINDILAIRDERLNKLALESHIIEQMRILREWGSFLLRS